MSNSIHKQQIINTCLDTFMERGLNHTSTRDLCKALNIHSGHIFYYFKTRDDIVLACAEEAKRRIEINLIGSALSNINNPEKLEKELYERATEMQPLMQFFCDRMCFTQSQRKDSSHSQRPFPKIQGIRPAVCGKPPLQC